MSADNRSVPGPKLLIVEDDDAVREMLTSQLRRIGYQVTSVSSADEALTLWGSEDFAIGLVDYTLGANNGLQLIERLLAIRNNARMVLMSGRIDWVIPPHVAGVVAFLPKPFTRAELLGIFASSD